MTAPSIRLPRPSQVTVCAEFRSRTKSAPSTCAPIRSTMRRLPAQISPAASRPVIPSLGWVITSCISAGSMPRKATCRRIAAAIGMGLDRASSPASRRSISSATVASTSVTSGRPGGQRAGLVERKAAHLGQGFRAAPPLKSTPPLAAAAAERIAQAPRSPPRRGWPRPAGPPPDKAHRIGRSQATASPQRQECP